MENKEIQNEQTEEVAAKSNPIIDFFKNKTHLYIGIAALAAVLVAVVVAVFACGGNDNAGAGNGGDAPAYTNTIELLDMIWNTLPENSEEFPKYAEDPESGERSYYFVGGDMTVDEETEESIVVKNGAGKVSLTEDMLYMHYFPMDMVSSVKEAASIYSMMGNGLFTVAAYYVNDASEISSIAAKIEEGVQNEWWMCCMPTRVVMVEAGNYLLAMYGQDAVQPFLDAALSAVDGAKIIIDNPIAR